jgi:hypothetical protein
MPRKKNIECREEQLSKMKPDVQFLRDQFLRNRFCAYEQSPHAKIPLVLIALKYVKLQQRKKAAGKEDKCEEKKS